jgi:hypothetical protein
MLNHSCPAEFVNADPCHALRESDDREDRRIPRDLGEPPEDVGGETGPEQMLLT